MADWAADGGDGPDVSPPTGGRAQYLFLVGLLAFVGSAVAFGADLVTGSDVLRSLLVNVAAAMVLVGWAAYDTLSDPDSVVDSAGGAAGTALLLYGIYLVLAAVVVAVTSLWHDRLGLALLGGVTGATLVLIGFLVFPGRTVLDGEEGTGTDDDDRSERGEKSTHGE